MVNASAVWILSTGKDPVLFLLSVFRDPIVGL